MRILVIDDDVTMLWSLCHTLRQWGSEVEAATGASAGLRMLEHRTFDIVLLDYRMPEHDGVWFLRNAVIPLETTVVLMTGFVDPIALSQMRCMGINEVLEKPFSQSDLQDRLQRLSVESTRRQHAQNRQTEREKESWEEKCAVRADDGNGRSHHFGAAAPHAA